MPTFVLALNYWLHLLATVVWIGGLAMLALVVWPGIIAASEQDAAGVRRLFDRIERRFQPLANISLAVLLVTGLIQMDGDPRYEGFLVIRNDWSRVMLIKHGVVAIMIGVTGVVQAVLLPEMRRASLLADKGAADDSTSRNRLKRLSLINLALGVLVLLLTALLTAL